MVRLIIALWMSLSQIPEETRLEHIVAATLAAQDLHIRGGTELLLAMAYVESRYDPTATSRIVDGRRVTGSWPSQHQAGNGPWFCGVLQTIANNSWPRCLAMRDIGRGYREGALELNQWLKVSHGNIRKALNGHGCGNAGLTNNCNNYGARVLARAKRLRHTEFI